MNAGVLTAIATVTCDGTSTEYPPIYLTITSCDYSSSGLVGGLGDPVTEGDFDIHIFGVEYPDGSMMHYSSSPEWSAGIGENNSTFYLAVFDKNALEYTTNKDILFTTDLPSMLSFVVYSGSKIDRSSNQSVPLCVAVTAQGTADTLTGKFMVGATDGSAVSLLVTVLWN